MLPWLAPTTALLLAGCAAGNAPPPAHEAVAERPVHCRQLVDEWDRLVAEAGVGDAQAARVPGFDFVRADRFLARHPAARDAGPGAGAWLDALRDRDREARRVELANLPPPGRDALERASGGAPGEAAERCAREEMDRLRASDAARAELARLLWVPDAYQPGARVLGLYPVTSTVFLAGVERLHRSVRATYATPLASLPVSSRLVRYVPPAAAAPAAPGWTADPLGVSPPPEPALSRLFAEHAPVWEIDVAGDVDRIGRPYWSDGGSRVDIAAPTVYRQLSHAWLDGRALLQLSYVAWFPSRPASGAGDVLAGHLDGITWRVTLDEDARPIAYDAMHNCGCYHMFYPGERLRRAPDRRRYEEPILVPQRAPRGGGRIVLRIAHRTHYIERVYRDGGHGGHGGDRVGEAVAYALADYGDLRSLPHPGGTPRSLFEPDGLVAGSERAERWLFWPMGVPSAGAMRQWGHHAVAFVGRRHFDDPDLLERYFERVP